MLRLRGTYFDDSGAGGDLTSETDDADRLRALRTPRPTYGNAPVQTIMPNFPIALRRLGGGVSRAPDADPHRQEGLPIVNTTLGCADRALPVGSPVWRWDEQSGMLPTDSCEEDGSTIVVKSSCAT